MNNPIMNMRSTLASLAILIVVGGGSFYAGMQFASTKPPQRFPQGQIPSGQRARFANGAGLVVGKVISLDQQTMTVQLGGPSATTTNAGATGSKIVLFSDATQVGKFVSGASADLKIGDTVMIQGNQNSDGSVTATSIQIRPENMGGLGPNRYGGER